MSAGIFLHMKVGNYNNNECCTQVSNKTYNINTWKVGRPIGPALLRQVSGPHRPTAPPRAPPQIINSRWWVMKTVSKALQPYNIKHDDDVRNTFQCFVCLNWINLAGIITKTCKSMLGYLLHTNYTHRYSITTIITSVAYWVLQVMRRVLQVLHSSVLQCCNDEFITYKVYSILATVY